MQADYKVFIDRVIQRYEGAYGWDKGDPGGPTKYGITCFDLAEHRHQKMNSMAAWAPIVRDMPLSEAEEIYQIKYAAGVGFDALPAGIDTVLLDYAINSGVSRALVVAKRLADIPTSSTLDALVAKLSTVTDRGAFIDAVCDERLRFMHAIDGGKMWMRFGGGWGARVADLRAYSRRIAAGSVPDPAPDLSKVITPKAQHQPKTAGASTGGAVIAAGAAAHQFQHSVAVTVAVMAAVIAAGVGYEIWQERKAQAANLVVHV